MQRPSSYEQNEGNALQVRSRNRASRASSTHSDQTQSHSLVIPVPLGSSSGAVATSSGNNRIADSEYQPPQSVSISGDRKDKEHRLSVGGILKNSNASKHASALDAVGETASSTSSSEIALKLNAAPMHRSSTFTASVNTLGNSIAVSGSAFSGVRRSVAIQIPGANSANVPDAISAGVTQYANPPATFQSQQHRLSMSVHTRSMTNTSGVNVLTPAPNHFYQQQQQMLNSNYRQTEPQIPSSPVIPVTLITPPKQQQHEYQQPQPQPQQQFQPTPAPTPLLAPTPTTPAPTPTPLTPIPYQTSPSPPLLKLPLTPEITVQYYRKLLTPYEVEEIFQYPHIYFAGAMGVEKIGSSRRKSGAIGTAHPENLTKEDINGIFNNGYDDSRGDYYYTSHDHIGYRYECISILGKGSFGQALKCFDHKTKTIVALKIIRNKKRFEKPGIVEVKVLDRLRKEDADQSHNLVHMQDSFYFRGHLCITFELLGINLYEWVKSGGFRGIHMGVLKVFTVQILECLKLLHRIKTIHCDLKPEVRFELLVFPFNELTLYCQNILLCDPRFLQPQKCDLIPSSSTGLPRSFIDPDFNPSNPLYDIKVIDFGSACYEHEKIYTYVQTRFYRSPEVTLGISYTVAVDMWSLGCILAELLTGYPLFPGENEQDHLACVMEIKGAPPEYIIDRGSRRKLFFDGYQPRIFINNKGKKRRPATKSLSQILRTTDVLFLDFIERCLHWDHKLRMKPEEAIKHEWITGISPKAVTISPNTSSAKVSIPSTGKYSFGDLMTSATNSVVNTRRELSLSINQPANPAAAEGKQKKTQSVAVSEVAATTESGEFSYWKAGFSSWRKSISGTSSSSKHVDNKDAEPNIKRDNQPLPSIPAATVQSMKRVNSIHAAYYKPHQQQQEQGFAQQQTQASMQNSSAAETLDGVTDGVFDKREEQQKLEGKRQLAQQVSETRGGVLFEKGNVDVSGEEAPVIRTASDLSKKSVGGGGPSSFTKTGSFSSGIEKLVRSFSQKKSQTPKWK
ncbi:Dual specificity tyrosine-phosphorylation-regulated kinase [Physocladia obscura]|uniref:dual-specificity kinase n=1 Tax=Physocladia obscura TaxID=109957 RepID=A0AAD5XCS5_9FUNG|nr:Dual specificity tyrosine-phosphorylation-regulated kinase [Physocladia obscura]